MANKVTITDTKNNVTITPQSNTTINTSTTNTPVTVTQGTTSVVTVNTPGPIGPQGNPGVSPGFSSDIEVRNITASGNISASGDVSATNVSASILRISKKEHAGQLKFFQDSDNSYRLTSNIGTIFDFGSTNVITTSQRIDGTRGMLVKTQKESDLIKFRDFDTNDIIVVDNSGSLTLGNTSAHEPYVTINTDLTASGNISASGNIIAKRWNNPADETTNIQFLDNTLVFQVNSEVNNALVLNSAGALFNSTNDANRDFKIGTGTTDDFLVVDAGKDTLTITGDITASGNISSSGDTISSKFNAGTAGGYYIQNGQVLSIQNTQVQLGNSNTPTVIEGTNITANTPLTASGDISASGDLTVNAITASGDLKFIGNTTIRNTNGTDDLTIDPQRDLNLGTNSTDNITLGRTGGWPGEIKFHTDTGNSMIITGSKVGIGTTTPSFALDITGSLSNTNQGGVVRFESSGSGDLVFNDGCEGSGETAIQFGQNGRISGEASDFNFSSANRNFTFNTGSGIRNITTPALTISGSGEIKLDYDNMPTADPRVKGVIFRSSSAGIDNLLFISPGL